MGRFQRTIKTSISEKSTWPYFLHLAACSLDVEIYLDILLTLEIPPEAICAPCPVASPLKLRLQVGKDKVLIRGSEISKDDQRLPDRESMGALLCRQLSGF